MRLILGKGWWGRFGPEEIGPLLALRPDARVTTSRRLPEILQLQGEGLSYPEIGRRLGLTKRAVEHAVARWRRSGHGHDSKPD